METVDLALMLGITTNSGPYQTSLGASSVLHQYGHAGMEDIQEFVRNQCDYEGVSNLARVQFLALVVHCTLKFDRETNDTRLKWTHFFKMIVVYVGSC